ncbi:unnamed protein product [Durusdinium trenchii]|uniref:Uncharacterized protein n=1 Tax=Durusdinium trenchii TaxID=1381693 RepID=A0ABP0SET2_9DINO
MADSEIPSSSSSPSMAARESSWREWSKRENGENGYKFGDFSRGLLHQMKVGVRDFKHKVSDTALTFKENSENRTVEYVQKLAATDEAVQDMAQSLDGTNASTVAERFWKELCKAAHTDHAEQMDETMTEESSGLLQVEVLSAGTDDRPLLRSDKVRAEKPVVLVSAGERRSKALKEGKAAKFQVFEILGADLLIFTFDRASSKFELGVEEKAFCGGCVLPLCAILQPEHNSGLGVALESSLRQNSFGVTLQLQLLPLPLLRTRRKLQRGDLSGVKMPQEKLGHVILKLSLHLKESPASLYFHPRVLDVDCAESKGHVSDPFSVIRAVGMALVRVQSALKLDLWKAAIDEMRENVLMSPILILWWTFAMLRAPLWTWPFLLNFFLGLFAWTLRQCHEQRTWRRLYIDEDGQKEDPPDVVKEAVKASLKMMQLTENLNKAAAQIEKLRFVLNLEDRCLSSICLMLSLVFCLPLCLASLVAQWICSSGLWRYLLWIPGSILFLPKAMRLVIFQELQRAQDLKQQLLGDELGRRMAGFWQRIPDETEASHLYLFKHYVFHSRQ